MVKDAELRDEPPATAPFPFPLHEDAAKLERTVLGQRARDGDALRAIREAAGDALLVGEVFVPTRGWPRYLEQLDLVFAFELLFSPWDAERLRAAIEPPRGARRVAG